MMIDGVIFDNQIKIVFLILSGTIFLYRVFQTIIERFFRKITWVNFPKLMYSWKFWHFNSLLPYLKGPSIFELNSV